MHPYTPFVRIAKYRDLSFTNLAKTIGIKMSDYSILKPVFVENPLATESGKARGPYKVFKEEIISLNDQGWAAWQIARKMNISRRSVQRVLRENS